MEGERGIDLFTSRWQNRELAELECVPVGISRGLPRFPTGYSYKMLRELAPSREAFGITDPEEFERAYVAGLEDLGLDAIVGRLATISRETGGSVLVLLCYEPQGEFCHRHLLSAWLRERGVEIRELAPGDVLRCEDAPQPSLFDGEKEGA